MTRHSASNFFWPFSAIVGLHFLCGSVRCVPLPSNSSSPKEIGSSELEQGGAEHNFTVTLLNQRDLVDTPEVEPVEFAEFSVKHISTLESVFETGIHLFDPFIHFIQTLTEQKQVLASEPLTKDKRMLYIA